MYDMISHTAYVYKNFLLHIIYIKFFYRVTSNMYLLVYIYLILVRIYSIDKSSSEFDELDFDNSSRLAHIYIIFKYYIIIYYDKLHYTRMYEAFVTHNI